MATKTPEEIAAEKAEADKKAAAEAKVKADADAKALAAKLEADARELAELRAYKARREAEDAEASNTDAKNLADEQLIRKAEEKNKHVRMTKGDEQIAVHHSVVNAHKKAGWTVA